MSDKNEEDNVFFDANDKPNEGVAKDLAEEKSEEDNAGVLPDFDKDHEYVDEKKEESEEKKDENNEKNDEGVEEINTADHPEQEGLVELDYSLYDLEKAKETKD